MNFASKKLKKNVATSGNLTAREKRLLVENRKLKKKNKRLSFAMVTLVDNIETRLPLWNKATAVYRRSKEIQASRLVKKKDALAKKATPPPPKKVIGTAWQPEKLEIIDRTVNSATKSIGPISMQKLFADKKKDRDDADIPQLNEVVPFPVSEPVPAPEVVELVEPARIIVADEPVDVVIEAPTITPALIAEEMDILAAPTRDKLEEGRGIPPELLTETEEQKTSAKDASLAYLAVSVASKPVPKTEQTDEALVIDHNDDKGNLRHSQENDLMRAAMLRRVNRLRW
jgi:hypothetical protein